MTRIALFALGLSALVPLPAIAKPVEVVAEIRGAMPTGITVTPGGRVFLNFPQWGDESPFAVAELIGGRLVPFPDTPFNRPGGDDPVTHLLSVQSVVSDGADRLWILDTGASHNPSPEAPSSSPWTLRPAMWFAPSRSGRTSCFRAPT